MKEIKKFRKFDGKSYKLYGTYYKKSVADRLAKDFRWLFKNNTRVIKGKEDGKTVYRLYTRKKK